MPQHLVLPLLFAGFEFEKAMATDMKNNKASTNAPPTQAHVISRPLPAPVCRRNGGAGEQNGGFPVGFPHREQNAASFGNSMLQCVQIMMTTPIDCGKGWTIIVVTDEGKVYHVVSCFASNYSNNTTQIYLS